MNSKFKIPYHVRRKTLSVRAGRMSRLPESEVNALFLVRRCLGETKSIEISS